MGEIERAGHGGPGKWTERGVPHRGWTCVWVEELHDERIRCEMCETREIRFVHHMEHPDHNDLRVGCICAGHMEEDLVRAKERERRLVNRSARRRNWLKRAWTRSKSGNDTLMVDGIRITIFPGKKGPGWSGVIARPDKPEQWSKRRYPTSDAAKLAAFDALYPPKVKPDDID